MSWHKKVLLLVILFVISTNVYAAQEDGVTAHPLDPLTTEEYLQTLQILQADGRINEDSRFPTISLREMPKADVLAWQPGDPISRQAFVVVKQGEQTFEAVVDLTRGAVSSWNEVVGVQPNLLFEEVINVSMFVTMHPDVMAALEKRGITDPNNVLCQPLAIGNFNIPEQEGRRLLLSSCLYIAEDSVNLFSRPIEGLYAIVDVNHNEIVEMIDTGVVPISQDPGSFDEGSVGRLREPLHPVVLHQPNGYNFSINGHVVDWQNWHIHERLDKRSGLVISNVTYQDGDNARSILYQGSLSEIFVPYMDPGVGWYSRTYMDEGEYGFGTFATTLAPGIDCPDTAVFLDAELPDDRGEPYVASGVICIFERNDGDPLWRHYDSIIGLPYEGRPGVELVLRMIAAVGNYDYALDWVFTQDGRIRVRIGATGIDAMKGTDMTSMPESMDDRTTVYGNLIAPNLIGVNHDHFFSFRLDMDVDGVDNSFEKTRLEQMTFDEGPRRSAWVLSPDMAMVESDAMMNYNPATPTMWMVTNPNVTSTLGYYPAYMLHTGDSVAYSLLTDDDYPQRRAGFTRHQLWVTPYSPDELYAAGDYVNQSKGGGGLPDWTSADRSIDNTDIVLWYTAGFHHVPHTEDYPIMPTMFHEFELLPFNFFGRNPALDVPANWAGD